MAILDGKLDVTTQAGYDVACILRGPDFAALEDFKQLLTVPIRRFMGIEMSSAWIVEPTRAVSNALAQWKAFCEWIVGVEDTTAQTFIKDAIGHWSWHLIAAYNVLLEIEPSKGLELLLAIAKALHSREGVSESLEAYARYLEEAA